MSLHRLLYLVSLGASFIKLILWSHSCLFSNFLNFFLLNKYVKDQMYSGKFFGFVLFGFLLISPLSYSLVSVVFVAFVLLVLNLISSCFIIQLPGHLVNLMVPFFQLTFGLCLTSQSWPKNMSVQFKSITAASNYSLWLLILIFRDTTLVTSPFFILFALETLNEKFISFIWILLSLISCSSITVCIHLESTSALTFNLFLFFVFISACIFKSCFPLLFR